MQISIESDFYHDPLYMSNISFPNDILHISGKIDKITLASSFKT